MRLAQIDSDVGAPREAEKRRILVVDANAPWVRSLFEAMPGNVEVGFLRIYHPAMFRGALKRPVWHAGRRTNVSATVWEEYGLMAGWTRFAGVSKVMVARSIRRALRRWGPVSRRDAVVFTLPQYARVLNSAAGVTRVYYAFDPFEFYDWGPGVKADEDAMLAGCEVSMAISQKLRDDFVPRARGQLFYSPNAVSAAFVERLRQPQAVPADLASLPRPIIGCTGQINATYDVDLIDALAARLPEMTFAFVGNVMESEPRAKARIEEVLARPNVKWLGRKEHGELPAYLSAFDVCFCPLAVTPAGDRRSPLRLYDYLATDRPIVSTAVAEAYVHAPHVRVGRNVDECETLLRDAVRPGVKVDGEARREYISRNTWQVRAQEVLDRLNESLTMSPVEAR